MVALTNSLKRAGATKRLLFISSMFSLHFCFENTIRPSNTRVDTSFSFLLKVSWSCHPSFYPRRLSGSRWALLSEWTCSPDIYIRAIAAGRASFSYSVPCYVSGKKVMMAIYFWMFLLGIPNFAVLACMMFRPLGRRPCATSCLSNFC